MRTISRALNIMVERFLPNPFLFAIILTLLTIVMGVTLGQQSLPEMAEHWYSGFWNFLTFGMQMVLILVTGYALAKAPLVNRLITNEGVDGGLGEVARRCPDRGRGLSKMEVPTQPSERPRRAQRYLRRL